MEQEEAVIARQRRGKHISSATNKHATIEENWKQCFVCGENLFTLLLPSNGRLFMFFYSGFRPSCHTINPHV
jgi:hypothetical protein